MFLLVAAAADETGRTITLLTAGLLGIAIGLTALTVWYWRFTNPRRQVPAILSSPVTSFVAPTQVLAGNVTPAVVAVVEEPPRERKTANEPSMRPVPQPTGDNSHGLDGEQWELLTQAVFETFLDEPETKA